MGGTPGSVQLVQCTPQSNAKPLSLAIRLVQVLDMSEPQLPSSHFTPTAARLFVCKLLLLSVMKVTNLKAVSAGQQEILSHWQLKATVTDLLVPRPRHSQVQLQARARM